MLSAHVLPVGSCPYKKKSLAQNAEKSSHPEEKSSVRTIRALRGSYRTDWLKNSHSYPEQRDRSDALVRRHLQLRCAPPPPPFHPCQNKLDSNPRRLALSSSRANSIAIASAAGSRSRSTAAFPPARKRKRSSAQRGLARQGLKGREEAL
eukprot:SAG11_NODE_15210_length_585_cov_1.279835_1_plen_149_part_10